jgi:7-carboxy-7-deazaguanine synthase (Cx14CxxC type)
MSYAVKEIFFTLQGEGAQSGRAAVFCRFAGCNLWSGREEDRASAVCRFCDTDFVGTDGTGGGKFATADALADAIAAAWEAPGMARRYVVLTGGEPLLQVDEALTSALHARGFTIAVETNGTLPAPPGLDWVCVSPKDQAELVLRQGNELKRCTHSLAWTRRSSRAGPSNTFSCSPWTGRNAHKTLRGPSPIACATPNGGWACSRTR